MVVVPESAGLDSLIQSRQAVATIVLVFVWTAETLVPLHFGRTRRLAHGAANLALALLNALLFQFGGVALLIVAEFSRTHQLGLLHRVALPSWATWIAALLLIDFWQYLWHRLNHQIPFLWRFHGVHHSDAEMDATTGVRFHTGEIALSLLARLMVVPVLGVTVPELLLYETLSLPIILFHHGNVRLSANQDRVLRWLIVTPWMHQVHHSRCQPETDSNYTSFLSIWDRLFGSFRLRDRPAEIQLGLDGWAERDWRRLSGMLAAPFRRRGP